MINQNLNNKIKSKFINFSKRIIKNNIIMSIDDALLIFFLTILKKYVKKE